jgi:hypothetical protein
VLYVDEDLTTHPKIYKAGELLGGAAKSGPAQALALYLAGLSYARHHVTNGVVPNGFVATCGLVQTPQAVANALSSRGVRLWHRVPGGYRIHDYFHWNPKSSEVKKKRAKWREQKRDQRRKANGEYRDVSTADMAADSHRDSCARGTKIQIQIQIQVQDLSSTSTPRSGDPGDQYGLRTLPALTRRNSRERKDDEEKHDASIGELATALCDRNGSDPTRADDGRRRVVRADQTAARRVAPGVSTAARADGGHARDGARARERRVA